MRTWLGGKFNRVGAQVISPNLGFKNHAEGIERKYKCGYFVEWRAADRLKRTLLSRIDHLLDTNVPGTPKLIRGDDFRRALNVTAHRPFRVVPYFDSGPWGGHWMEEVCELPRDAPNYAWCFDCVPEENSLLLGFGGHRVEIPAIDVVFAQPEALLGQDVYRRFGAEFPIRFDLLDTMDGGNLSLQVHPLPEYIHKNFGMSYTQDESYYVLDAGEDACVYLGLKQAADPDTFLQELRAAQVGRLPFPVDLFVNTWPAHKHDHFLIPAGTVHCSGRNSMVLEISATPYIFTFKLWDWGRTGLNGMPRPIHIDHGAANIQWDRRTDWVQHNLINRNAQSRPDRVGARKSQGFTNSSSLRRTAIGLRTKCHTILKAQLTFSILSKGQRLSLKAPVRPFRHLLFTTRKPSSFRRRLVTTPSVRTASLLAYGCATIKAFVRPSNA